MVERIFTGRIPLVGKAGSAAAAASGTERLLQPLYLLSDSQLLFWTDERGSFVERVAERLPVRAPRAAYIGASNRDNPDYYTIFLAAMEALGPADCRMIRSRPTTGDVAFLESADVVLLSGGEVDVGWRVLRETGLAEQVVRRYLAGAALIGVSAGAVQIGEAAAADAGDPSTAFSTLGLAPFVVSVHDEKSGWESLQRVVLARGEGARGVGIPSGGGLVLHPQGVLEAVRHPACEMVVEEGRIVSSVVLPPAEAM
jgi:peptidase E